MGTACLDHECSEQPPPKLPCSASRPCGSGLSCVGAKREQEPGGVGMGQRRLTKLPSALAGAAGLLSGVRTPREVRTANIKRWIRADAARRGRRKTSRAIVQRGGGMSFFF